jgi:hypothetical protein
MLSETQLSKNFIVSAKCVIARDQSSSGKSLRDSNDPTLLFIIIALI